MYLSKRHNQSAKMLRLTGMAFILLENEITLYDYQSDGDAVHHHSTASIETHPILYEWYQTYVLGKGCDLFPF